MQGACELNRLKTHCPAGHPLEGSNLLKSKQGWRNCRTCHNANTARYKLKEKEEAIEYLRS